MLRLINQQIEMCNLLVSFITVVSMLDRALQIKWYEGSTQANAGIDEEAWKNLWEYGVCNDILEFRRDVRTRYLGMDVFMKFLGKFEGETTILMIHQVNAMLSRTFRENLSVRELFTGQLMDTKRQVDPVARQLVRFCPSSKTDNSSSYITGFSVPEGAGQIYLVCESKVLRFSAMEQVAEVNWNKPNEVFDRVKSCHNSSAVHPVFCDRPNGIKLMSIAAIPRKQDDDDPILLGYYSADRGQIEEHRRRDYKIAAYSYKSRALLNEEITVSGYLSEIDVFSTTNFGFAGMYFTIDGNACTFTGTFKDLTEHGTLKNINFEDNREPRKPCQSFQSYIGCPMPFCFSNRFDASFTITKNGKIIIYFMRGLFFWIIEDSGLPLNIPRVKDALKPMRYIKLEQKPTNIFKWTFDKLWKLVQKLLGLIYYSNSPCSDYIDDGESVVCMPRDVGASFAVSVQDARGFRVDIIYIYETAQDKWFVAEGWGRNSKNQMIIDPFTGQAGTKYDAAWYNGHEKTVYLFSGKKYTSYEHAIDNGRSWKRTGKGQLSDFGVDFPLLDAVVNRNDMGYFFYENFYHEVPETQWRQKARRSKLLSFQTFFDVRRECYFNSEKRYEDLVSRHFQRNYSINEQQSPVERETEKLKWPRARSRLYITFVVAVAFITVASAWLAMFIYGRRRKILVKSKAVWQRGPGKKSSLLQFSREASTIVPVNSYSTQVTKAKEEPIQFKVLFARKKE